MKKLFSFLFLFSAFTLIALPFFLNPNFALAVNVDDCLSSNCTLSGEAYCKIGSGIVTTCTKFCKNNPNSYACSYHACDKGASFSCSNRCPIATDPLSSVPCCGDNGTTETFCSSYCDTHTCAANNTCSEKDCIECTGADDTAQCCEDNGTIKTKIWCSSYCSGSTAICNGSTLHTDSSSGTCTCTAMKDYVSRGSSIKEGLSQTNCDRCDSTICGTFTETGITYSCAWTETAGGITIKDTPSATPAAAAPLSLKNPLGVNTVPELVKKVINVALGVVGSLALIMFIYGGFTWMLAAGNEQAVEKGRNILVWATIGLVVIFASYSLVNFVITSLVAK